MGAGGTSFGGLRVSWGSSTSGASLGSRRASQNRIEPHIPGPFSNLAKQISSLCEEEFSGDNHMAFGCTGAFIKEGEAKTERQTDQDSDTHLPRHEDNKWVRRSSRRGAAETNPTRNHDVVGSIPSLAHWVKDPALP